MSLSFPTVDQLKTELADELGEDSADTEVTDRIEKWLNDTFEDILARQSDWKWTRDYKELVLSVPYSTGTVTTTQGSAIVTGSGTVWETTWKNRIFYVPGTGVNYRVATVDSATQLTLETQFQEDLTAGQTYVVVQNRYPIDNQAYESGISQFINPYATDPLDEIDMETFLRRYPRLQDQGDPTLYAVWGQEATDQTNGGAPMVYFNRYPNTRRVFQYWYHKQFDRLTGTQKFPIPYRFNRLLLKAGVKLRSGRFDNDQGQDLRQEYEAYIQMMIQDNSKTGDRSRGFKETDVPRAQTESARFPVGYPDVEGF